MTVARDPLTIEDALYTVLGFLGAKRAAAVVGLSVDYLTSVSNPNTPYRLTFEDGIKLDLAYEAAGGPAGSPIRDTYLQLHDLHRAEQFADAAALSTIALEALREGSEAQIALFEAAQPGASPAKKAEAVREVQQALAKYGQALPLLVERPEPPP